jgi:glucokinase
MYLGIEIGGTKLQLGLGNGDGKLAGLWRSTVDPQTGADGIRRQILDGVSKLVDQTKLAHSDIAGVGIGFGGPVDDGTSRVIKSHQIQGWDDFPLAPWVSDMLGWPAVLGNDADVAGLAEASFGAGRGMSPVFYITLGSGIGGGLIVNGAIQRGCGRGAAEIGHLRLAVPFPDGIRYLPLEELASGWAIEQGVRAQTARAEATGFLTELARSKQTPLTARDVALAAGEGDDDAWYILYRAWTSLAEAICHIIALVCPRRIVIGGGVSLMGERLLFEPLRKLVAERVFPPFADCFEIVPAALGEEVVVHGALALARRETMNQWPLRG